MIKIFKIFKIQGYLDWITRAEDIEAEDEDLDDNLSLMRENSRLGKMAMLDNHEFHRNDDFAASDSFSNKEDDEKSPWAKAK